jgi:hypothetical protein
MILSKLSYLFFVCFFQFQFSKLTLLISFFDLDFRFVLFFFFSFLSFLSFSHSLQTYNLITSPLILLFSSNLQLNHVTLTLNFFNFTSLLFNSLSRSFLSLFKLTKNSHLKNSNRFFKHSLLLLLTPRFIFHCQQTQRKKNSRFALLCFFRDFN